MNNNKKNTIQKLIASLIFKTKSKVLGKKNN